MNKIDAIIPLGLNRKLEINNLDKKNIRLIIERGDNPSQNRNRGIKKAKTKFVAFFNAHTILTENWAGEVEKFFKEHPEIDIVGGPMLTEKDAPIFERASGYALSSILGAAEVRTRYKIKDLNLRANEKHLTSANLICRKKVFKKVLFDEALWPGEDPKFISDAIKSGFKVAYSPSIQVYQKRRKNFSSLIKQIFNYGFTRTRKENFIETLKKPLFLIPSVFIIYLALLPTLLLINNLFLFPLALYIVLNLGFSLFESIKNKDFASFFLLPFIFLAIHISYGAGFLYGLITKSSAELTNSLQYTFFHFLCYVKRTLQK